MVGQYIKFFSPIKDQCVHDIESSRFICYENQLTEVATGGVMMMTQCTFFEAYVISDVKG